ncbi:c-type cytochrome [Bradyrhizobium sp. CCBAU 45384]|uniref:c-type cytochrome n=1 Tax=Bradyrhizobium sp. CCBAU 45384 TaxID=858428 RepID=UPI002306A96F|nr:cytochrome c [Bradyrhizobium sp. CCBAU 45384]MDA9408121.1 cytochrome C [Bradyrhizobium sp. CCBAU 45384]
MIERLAIPVCAVLLLSSCDDVSMTQQKRYGTLSRAALFENGSEAQPLPEGVVAQGDVERKNRTQQRPHISAGLLARGRERYDIYCSPCHGLSGQGDGMIVQRGFPAPPSYHSSRLRAAPAAHFFDVITNGHGVMFSYAARIDPSDRWAIVAYIRALQESQGANVADTPELRTRLP